MFGCTALPNDSKRFRDSVFRNAQVGSRVHDVQMMMENKGLECFYHTNYYGTYMECSKMVQNPFGNKTWIVYVYYSNNMIVTNIITDMYTRNIFTGL